MTLLPLLPIAAALTVAFADFPARAEDFYPPAGVRYPQVRGKASILPDGRFIQPLGTSIETGPNPYGLAISPGGTAATADIGRERFGVTILDAATLHTPTTSASTSRLQARHIWARTPNSSVPEIAPPDWKSVASGIVFDSEKSIWISEGESGKIRQLDLATGDHKKIINLATLPSPPGFSGELAFDTGRHLLYAIDQANARLIIVDSRKGRILSTTLLGPEPFAVTLSPDRFTAYVSEAKAVCFIDVHNPVNPTIVVRVPAPSPEALLAIGDSLFASNSLDDSVTVISTTEQKPVRTVSIVIPGLEKYRGVIPSGMAYDPVTKWLLVAETGINAVAIIDTVTSTVIGHLPAGWMPTRVAIHGDRVYVANARGLGAGPNVRRIDAELFEAPTAHRGSVSTFIMPGATELPSLTAAVFSYSGSIPEQAGKAQPPELPKGIRHVVLIVQGNHTFDEVFGDIGGQAVAFPGLARFGMHGRALGRKTQFSVQDAAMTPNQHALALRWAFSDNFYSDGNTSLESDIFLSGAVPDLVGEVAVQSGRAALPANNLAQHLRQAGMDYRVTEAAADVLAEPPPGLLVIRLPKDREQPANPQTGHPFPESWIADNDLAVGLLVARLSHTGWWRSTAVFITENATEGSLDHVDANRTLLVAAGPWAKKNYISHVNSSFPGLLRTIFELLGAPPLGLMDATAASLRGMFTMQPDLAPFDALGSDHRIFNPSK